jgi:hypothetical protein
MPAFEFLKSDGKREPKRLGTSGSSGAQIFGKFGAELRIKIEGWIMVELTGSNRKHGKLRGSGGSGPLG